MKIHSRHLHAPLCGINSAAAQRLKIRRETKMMTNQTIPHTQLPGNDFRKKHALITGSSRGIGKAAAEIFAQNGYDLTLTCRNSISELHALAQSLTSAYGIVCQPLQANMGDEKEVSHVFSHIKHLDVLVNNAGISHLGLLTDMTADQWHNIIAVNLDSCFYTCRAAIPLMLQNHSGRIVNISSVWGLQGASMEVAYSASKGGMNAFTKALAKELAPSNIQVNAIACGVIDTKMNECFSEEERELLKDEIPADRFGTPEEAANLIFQISQAPPYMTGQIIALDGGWC